MSNVNIEIANTILQQLGGNKFIAMTGSSKFVAGDRSLNMKLTRNKAGAQYLKITLNSMDLYDMTFYKVKKDTLDLITVKEYNGVYNDMLQSLFTSTTGLYTTL